MSEHRSVAEAPGPRSSPAETLPALAPRPAITALTGVRFLAALDVVLYHFDRVPLPAWAHPLKNIIASGYVGVSLFFLLSGFIMAYSYLAPQGDLRGSRRNFYATRFARIYPAYFLGFLLAAPTDILLSLHANHLRVALVKLLTSAFLVLTLQQAWTPWTAWAWNFPAWSVSVEVFFYLLFPFLGPRLARIRSSYAFPAAAGIWILSLAAPAALYLLRGPTGPPQLGDHLQMAVEFTPLLRLPEFALGILLGRAFVAGRFARLPGSLLSLVAAVAILAVMVLSPHIPHPFLAGGLLTPLFALLLVSLAQGKGSLAWLLSLPALILLGEASYGIYILQIPVSFVLHVPPPLTSAATLLFYCASLIVIALLSFRFVETPLRGRLRNWLGDPHPHRTPGHSGILSPAPAAIPCNDTTPSR